MRGQHKLDLQPADRAVKSVWRDAGLQEAGEDFIDRSGLRSRAGPLILTSASDAVMLFGDIRQREKVRERPRDRYRGADRKRP
jgi:hypothetical protein